MVLTAHILVGAALAQKIPNLGLGLFSAFLSHYFLDSLIHKEYSADNIEKRAWRNSFFDFLKIFLDGAFGVFLVLWLSRNMFLGLAGGLAAALPDVISHLHLILPKIKILSLCSAIDHKTHWFKRYGFHKKIPLLWDIASQTTMAVLIAYFLR